MNVGQPDPIPAPSESARSPLERAIETIVQNVDPAKIQDEVARQCVMQLLNLVERLAGELRKAQAEIQFLRQQRGSGKAGGGKPDSAAGVGPGSAQRSSEQRRRETKEWNKSRKLVSSQ